MFKICLIVHQILNSNQPNCSLYLIRAYIYSPLMPASVAQWIPWLSSCLAPTAVWGSRAFLMTVRSSGILCPLLWFLSVHYIVSSSTKLRISVSALKTHPFQLLKLARFSLKTQLFRLSKLICLSCQHSSVSVVKIHLFLITCSPYS